MERTGLKFFPSRNEGQEELYKDHLIPYRFYTTFSLQTCNKNHALALLQLQFIDNYQSLDTPMMAWTGILYYVWFSFLFTVENLHGQAPHGKKKREGRNKKKGVKRKKRYTA